MNLQGQRDLLGREPCCEDDWGGSHYHCGRCGGTSSMMGHYRSIHWVDGKPVKTEGHFCCPKNCALENNEN